LAAQGQRTTCDASELDQSSDIDLAAVVSAWPELRTAIKAGIVAMIKAARP
jgi:hypothetical protein